MGDLPFNIQWLQGKSSLSILPWHTLQYHHSFAENECLCSGSQWTVLSDELASQAIVFLLQRRSTTRKKFTSNNFKHVLLTISVQNQMHSHIAIKKADMEAKFQSTLGTLAELQEQLNEVLMQVDTGFFDTKITTPNLPDNFMVAVKKAVWEVHPFQS
jgi:hypothetical protein